MLKVVRGKVLTTLLPVIKWFGSLHLPYTKRMLTAGHYYQILDHAFPGLVLLSRTMGEPTNLLIPGKYKHCAIMGGTIAKPFVIEATGKGVHQTDLIDFILSKDHIVLLKPNFANDGEMLEAAMWARQQIGKPYDYEFQSNYKSFYCCELSYASYREALEGNSPWELREYWGEPTVTPDDFLASGKWTKLLEF